MVRPADERSAVEEQHLWFGHPRPLARLFTTEMWERFGYYGMRALLMLYLVKHFQFKDVTANGLYGAFTSLVYLTPLFGGMLADQILGYKRSVKFGAVLMSFGYFMLCFGGEQARPYLDYQGTRHPVFLQPSAESSGEQTDEKLVTIDGTQYRIAGQDNGALKLDVADPKRDADVEPLKLAKGTYEFDGERNPFWVNIMFLSLACVIIGNGFFKPNISTMVGALYPPGDARRDSGFTIFYMGINLGSTISQGLCPILQERIGFAAGFLLAAIGMFFAWALIQFEGKHLHGIGDPKTDNRLHTWMVYLGAFLTVPVIWWLLHNTMMTAEQAALAAEKGEGILGYLMALPFLGKALFLVSLAAVIGIPIWSFIVGTRQEAEKMVVAVVLVVFSVVFWTLFEQAGSSLTLYADRNTDRVIESSVPLFSMFVNYSWTKVLIPIALSALLAYVVYWTFSYGGDEKARLAVGVVSFVIFLLMSVFTVLAAWQVTDDKPYVMPAGQTQVFNPVFIVLFAPVLSWLWIKLAERGLEPTIPVKFAIGLILVGLGFWALVYGARHAGIDFRIPLFWLGLAYFLHSIGELCLSPVGLSMITKLSMTRVVGLMMGVWFLASSMAQYVAGIVAQTAATETVGGVVTDPEKALATYLDVFRVIGWIGIAAGVLLFILSVPLRRMMHGVR